MDVVITGASGNVGTAVIASLLGDPSIEGIVAVARRRPGTIPERTRWITADVGTDDLSPAMRGADAVIHLAWAIQPSRDQRTLFRTNVVGSSRVVAAALDAGVGTVVHASSVGVYSRGPKDRAVDESWPREGTPTSFYGRHKAEVERRLDAIEKEAPDVRIVRMRPALIFSSGAASGIRRLFLGGLIPRALLSPGRIPLVPDVDRLRFQAVHSADVGEAYRLALGSPVRGGVNVAADPVLDPRTLAQALGARRVPLPATALRAAVAASWHARIQPTPPGWVDMALAVPVMDCAKARTELGWTPRRSSIEALLELLEGMSEGSGLPTPPLRPAA